MLETVAAACCFASLLSAQAQPQTNEANAWALQGLRNGYCVHFLVEPEAATKQLKKGFSLVHAQQDSTLHPALQQVIKSQPEFASWAPSDLCLYYLDAVQIGKRRIAERDPRNYELIVVWTIATQEQGSGTRRDLVLDMFANRDNLLKAAEVVHVRLHEVHSSYYDRPDTTSDVYNLKIGKTQMTWAGRPVGDSTRVEQPKVERWSVNRLQGGIQPAEFLMLPAWSRGVVGSLSVEGKGDLAKLLRGSPIRFVGPLYRGGGGEIRFSR
jgi:hypothetical protein